MMASRRKNPSRTESAVRRKLLRDLRLGDEPTPTHENLEGASKWLEAIFKEHNWQSGLEEEALISSWQEVAGSFVAQQTEVVSLTRGCLTLRVAQPAMKFHLEQMKGELLQGLQNRIGADKLRTIRLVVT